MFSWARLPRHVSKTSGYLNMLLGYYWDEVEGPDWDLVMEEVAVHEFLHRILAAVRYGYPP